MRRYPRGHRMVMVAALVVVVAAVTAVLVARPNSHRPAPAPPTTTVGVPHARYLVSTDGSGDCVVAACRTINAAVARAKVDHAAGALIELAAGSYGSQTISDLRGAPTLKSNVLVQPMPGAHVEIRSVVLKSSNVTIRHLVVNGSIRLDTGAVASGLDGVTTHGGSVYLGASAAFVLNSSITPTTDSDGIQVKAYHGANPQGVRIERTTIGPTHRGPKRGHVDCIQVLGAHDVTIRYNRLFHCASQGIISSAGASGQISGTLDIERNEIEQCPERTYDCDGHNAVNLTAPRVVFVHNTVIDGGVTFSVPDLTVAANYIENLKSCSGVIESNLIRSTNCSDLPTTNLRGALSFVDASASPPDLTPRDAVIVPDGSRWLGGTYSSTDIDGRDVNSDVSTVGAVQIAKSG